MNVENNIENQNHNLIKTINDEPPPLRTPIDPTSPTQQRPTPSMDIIICLPFVVNLDDNKETTKIDEVHNYLNFLFSSSMILNDNNYGDPVKLSDAPHVQPGDSPSTTLDVVPLASDLHSIHTKQDWDADDLLHG